MKQIFCPWVSETGLHRVNLLRSLCGRQLGKARKDEETSLADFLTSSSAQTYFKRELWASYGTGWEWFAFLTLLKLWASDLDEIHYGQSETIATRDENGFSLSSLIKPDNDVVFVENDSNQKSVASVTKYSKKEWTVLLQDSSNEHNGSGQSLSVTLSGDQLCIRGLVCLTGRNLVQERQDITRHLRNLDRGTFGNFLNLLLKDTQGKWDSKKTFMALIAACFNDVENVSLTVQEPSDKGDLIFTHLK